jgi:hypothetical protein
LFRANKGERTSKAPIRVAVATHGIRHRRNDWWIFAVQFEPARAQTDKSFLLLFFIVPKARLRHDKEVLVFDFGLR